MKKKIMIAGFGGQGVMSIGKSLVEAGMEEGLEVSWVPSYGPEMRGGTANCSVTLSDRPVAAPVFSRCTELIAMNYPSLLKFAPTVDPEGIIFINSSIITEDFDRPDVTIYRVPCDDIARGLGNVKCANMVMLGAVIAATGAVSKETVEKMIHHIFSGPKAKLADLNIAALSAGMDSVAV
ncbi:MAG: 2-oxoacid:acceptor oxidoreductase family protein [Oscillospiraceae bacterium]|nr:2-oxoacid:acceptor oxidoreductase family protein [Oscillospiraceae bacterium]